MKWGRRNDERLVPDDLRHHFSALPVCLIFSGKPDRCNHIPCAADEGKEEKPVNVETLTRKVNE